ncbi:MAG: serine hydrolase [bacterium]|nr:serine hydrolase [bacterium]
MNKRFAILVTFIVLFAAAGFAQSLKEIKPERAGMSSERLERIDGVMRSFIDNHELSGVITLITRRGKITQFKAYGYRDLETRAPMEKDCLFRMFSMTKPITCTAVLMLVEEGKILLTDPVSKYLPEFKDMKVLIKEKDGEIITEPAQSPITIQELAMHTSGLGYGIPASLSPTLSKKFDEANVFDPRNTIKNAIETIASFPLLHQPGTTWEYGASIDVLARLVEVVSGQPYGGFLKERIFEPLGMTDSGFSAAEKDWDRVARLYSEVDGELKRNMDEEDYYKYGTLHGGGSGLVSGAMDYARFMQMLANGGELDGVRILSPQSVERMSTNLIRDEKNNTPWFNDRAQGFGLGVSVVKDPAYLDSLSSVGTWGWSGYASTYFFIDPEKEVAALFMAQFVPANAHQWWQRYTNLVYQAIVD